MLIFQTVDFLRPCRNPVSKKEEKRLMQKWRDKLQISIEMNTNSDTTDVKNQKVMVTQEKTEDKLLFTMKKRKFNPSVWQKTTPTWGGRGRDLVTTHIRWHEASQQDLY